MNEVLSLKEGFLEHLKRNNKSEKTLENYSRYLDRFLRVTKVKKVHDISPLTVKRFRSWLHKHDEVGKETKIYSAKTINYHLVAVRALLVYARACGHNTLLPKEVLLEHVPFTSISATKEEDFWNIYKCVDGKDGKSYRDKAILLLLATTGLKVSELCALDRSSLENEEVHVPGKVPRIISLVPECNVVLTTYLSARRDSDNALFVNNGKRSQYSGDLRLTTRSVQRIVKQYSEKAGVNGTVTPQSLRNMFVASLMQKETGSTSLREKIGYMHESTAQKLISDVGRGAADM